MTEMPIEEQAAAAVEFTRGLVDRLGLRAEVHGNVEDDVIDVQVTGEDLGLLIGERAATMTAMQELVKTALQRQTEGHNAWLRVDVGGYDERRREALVRFAEELAEKALQTGRPQALEPMGAADRKIVHDAVTEVEGVTTESEGEEPRRRVVIRRDG